VKTNCFEAQMNLPIANVVKKSKLQTFEIKNNAVCDVIDVLQRQLSI